MKIVDRWKEDDYELEIRDLAVEGGAEDFRVYQIKHGEEWDVTSDGEALCRRIAQLKTQANFDQEAR